ncbi:hypothetical protein ACQKD0_05190 [Vreelandella aquamarina]|uniref:hypothetical protein n=1 Tax=Vreelandella aquamarina TaxID=77097 RepID=UPI003D08A59F
MRFPIHTAQHLHWIIETYRVDGVVHTVRARPLFPGLPWLVIVERHGAWCQMALTHHVAPMVQLLLSR